MLVVKAGSRQVSLSTSCGWQYSLNRRGGVDLRDGSGRTDTARGAGVGGSCDCCCWRMGSASGNGDDVHGD